MTDIETIFDDAAEKLFNRIGRDAIYTPVVGSPVNCKIVIERDVDLEPLGFNAQIWGRGITIEAVLSELGKEPDAEETFTVDGIIYEAQTVKENDGRFVLIIVKKIWPDSG